jgi:hypothetical protein
MSDIATIKRGRIVGDGPTSKMSESSTKVGRNAPGSITMPRYLAEVALSQRQQVTSSFG